ncbi:GTPase Obg [subsurface metagenome]
MASKLIYSVDRVEIGVKGGGGGDGVVSFRREKFVPFGGPDGGDGGKGGNVSVRADASITSLLSFRKKRGYRAAEGKDGGGKRKHGKKGAGLTLMVPVGTVVLYKTPLGDEFIVDLEEAGEEAVVARGGKGGLGNIQFTTATKQAPKIAQKGEAGEEQSIILELRLIADAGIIGYPNVGKSTLLAAVSAAKPKIASYPFTTIEPILGRVEVNLQSFVLAEIPGLISGAHLGRGLGHDFLRHIIRTKMLVHLIDGGALSPAQDMAQVNTEMSLFDSALAEKPQLVVVNKIDLPEVRARLAEIKDSFNQAGVAARFISAATGEGVSELMTEVMKRLQGIAHLGIEAGGRVPRKIFRPQPKRIAISVHKEGDAFIVVAPELERIVARVDVADAEVRGQLKKRLNRLGVSKALEKAGVKPGDRIRCGALEWEW